MVVDWCPRKRGGHGFRTGYQGGGRGKAEGVVWWSRKRGSHVFYTPAVDQRPLTSGGHEFH